MKHIYFTSGEAKLSGNLFQSEKEDGKGPGILFLHGWESKQDRYFALAKELAGEGFNCLTFDMRGHGDSEGDITLPSRREFLGDACRAYDYLMTNSDIDSGRIFAVGSSFGGYLAALLTVQRQLGGVALRAPADYPDESFDAPASIDANALYENPDDRQSWTKKVHEWTETAALRAIHNFEGRILLIESGKDEVVPREIIRSYEDAVPDKDRFKYVLMKDAPHGLSKHENFQREFAGIVLTWLKGKHSSIGPDHQ